MARFLIIADDLTGANDTGVGLARFGYTVQTVTNPTMLTAQTWDNLVIDTESRHLSPTRAYEKVTEILDTVDTTPYTHVVKKIDSTLRGSIVAEIQAVYASYQPALVVFMPALPSLGRTTVGGIHLLHGVPITQTEMAGDPQAPVTVDNIVQLLTQAIPARPVCHIGLNDDIGRQTSVLYTVDATTDSRMQQVIRQVLAKNQKILWIGSGALVDNLIQVLSPSLPSFGLVGSVSAIASQQLDHAEQQGIGVISMNPTDLLAGKLTSYVSQVREVLQSGTHCVLASAASRNRDLLSETLAMGQAQGLSTAQTSQKVQQSLAQAAAMIIEQNPISGVFVTGGDTAIGLFNHLNVQVFQIIDEVLVGMPLLRLPQHNHLKVITKAGAFGHADTMSFALRKLASGGDVTNDDRCYFED